MIFIPALAAAGVFLFIRVVQYEPLFPKRIDEPTDAGQTLVPVFDDDAILGSLKAPITLIAFEDFGCPACKDQDALLKQLIAEYPDKVKVVVKLLSVTRFPYSTQSAHRYGWCARAQGKFSEFKDLAFVNADNLSPQTIDVISQSSGLDEKKLAVCLSEPAADNNIDKNRQLAEFLNVRQVPTFFLNNRQLRTPQSIDQWKVELGLH